jgi:hypothetical protein
VKPIQFWALVLLFGVSTPTLACGLDDCSLPASFHRVGLESPAQAPRDQWSWMNHELAVARAALSEGRRVFALETAHALYSALEAQGLALVAHRGDTSVQDFADSLQELVAQCGGVPLEELQLALRTTR